ncbi:MAG: hypothetical protein SGI74_04070 [Oligoflexia bacterium]|nr:hypothetical protein [Oligoflexia bacterium]
MKLLVISFLCVLISSVSFASGYECQGQGYRVKMYNHVQPVNGTSNPAVLIVSSENRDVGTIGTARGVEISKAVTARTEIYEAKLRVNQTGRYAGVNFQVTKEPGSNGLHWGRLVLAADGASYGGDMACRRYLKDQR